MPTTQRARFAGLLLGLSLVACQKAFNPRLYPSNEGLYQASMREFERGKWSNALLGFEKLSIDLPARDSLLPRVHFYLGQTHLRKREYLLAAQSFTRLTESFPDDTLADDALLAAGRAYGKMWRKPGLDATYGESATATYRTFLAIFPSSPLRGEVEAEIARLEEKFATKDFETGDYYMRRKAYDPALIYFRDIVREYPNTAVARRAYLRMLEAYREINYREDAAEICATLRERYSGDREVIEACGGAVGENAAPAPASTPEPAPEPAPAAP